MAALTEKAADTEKTPCASNITKIPETWASIIAKDVEVEKEREETQGIRFEVETLTHRMKHYSTLCEAVDDVKVAPKKKKASFMQLSQNE